MRAGQRASRIVRGPCWWHAIALLIAGGGCHGSSSTDATSTRDTPQRVYELHCLGCHGAHGEGTWGSNIQGLNRTDQQIISVIVNGRGKMPAFKRHFSEQQLRQLAEYVKTFKYQP